MPILTVIVMICASHKRGYLQFVKHTYVNNLPIGVVQTFTVGFLFLSPIFQTTILVGVQ